MERGFTLYRSDIEALRECMDASSVLDLICSMTDYAADGTVPNDLNPVQKMAFSLLKTRVEVDRDTVEQKPVKASVSKSRSEAAKDSWSKRKKTKTKQETEENEAEKAEEQETPAEMSSKLYDPGWKKVADTYQKQIGLLPMGVALEKLISYVDDIGADAVCVAIEYTNEWQAKDPPKFLAKILNKWAEDGIDTEEKARASILEWKRNKAQNDTGKMQKTKDASYEPPAIEGGWY